MHERLGLLVVLALAFPTSACDESEDDHGAEEHDDDHGHDDHGHDDGGDDGHNHTEIISTVELTFTPDGDGDAVVARFEDPDGDGGVSGMSDPIALVAGTTYTLAIRFLNELDEAPEDITEEIREEAEEHMVFIGGDAPVDQTYADVESDYGENAVGDDLPVGLVHTITTDAVGEGTFRVMLRHLPELNGEPQKSADLPDGFANGDSLPGDVDADVSFDLSVE